MYFMMVNTREHIYICISNKILGRPIESVLSSHYILCLLMINKVHMLCFSGQEHLLLRSLLGTLEFVKEIVHLALRLIATHHL